MSPSALVAERKDIETQIEENLKEKLFCSNEIARLTREIADVDVSVDWRISIQYVP